MNENKVIKLDKFFVKAIEEADYDYATKRDVVAMYINNGLDTSSAAFINYQKNMTKAYADFNKFKNRVEKEYVLPIYPDTPVNWNLDYDTCELTIKNAIRIKVG